MKQIKNVTIATFDGAQFATAQGLGPFAFYSTPNSDGQTMILTVPDVVPDDAQLVFDVTPPKTESKKLAEALVQSNLTDDVEWGKLLLDEKLERIRQVYIKSAALQISGKIDSIDPVGNATISP